MNGSIRRKLIEVEDQSGLIEQRFKRAITLDRNWRESRRKEERLKGRKENNRALAPRLNHQGTLGQALPWPQVWPRRQETPQQWVLMGPVLIEDMERTNTVIAISQQKTGFPQKNPYTMDVDRENRNCYACREFRHLARHCRNRGMEMNRRIEVDQNTNNLNGEGGLGSSN